MSINELKLIELFCELDDFCTLYEQKAVACQLTATAINRCPAPLSASQK